MNTAMDCVRTARAMDRPTGRDYIAALIRDFLELHGDRRFGDDPAVIGGVGWLEGLPVTVIALDKGKDTKDRVARNFGSANPEGYRKALRLMKQAEKFHRPVLCLVDTSGANCGIGAEERGQGQAIAENLLEMSGLAVPVISVFIGEGGSGGALALAVADEVWMLENAVYSVISPEGCASILWKDPKRVDDAAERLRLTARDLLALGVIERILPEAGFDQVYATLRQQLPETFRKLQALPEKTLLAGRYQRFRKMGADALCMRS